MERLGVLTKVDIRKFWEDEARNFTPWLADEENIGLLGETIGLELEVEAQERNVGQFRADILCRDTVTDNWVVIENQLERTDHTHLGQLLTYAAGLDAVTVVWIAKGFTDEHRAALDWCNEITDEKFSFFGLEIELWQIGDSPMAPKFNVVSHPNDWAKTVSRISRTELTDTDRLYLGYWTGLQDLLEQRDGVIRPVKSWSRNWIGFGIGRSNFWLSASAWVKGKRICVSLTLAGEDAKPHFYLLEQDKVNIEKEIRAELDWGQTGEQKLHYIDHTMYDTNPEDRQDWNRQHQWLCEQLEAFHRVFSQRVKELDASDYLPAEDETAE